MVGDPGTQAIRPQRAAQINVISALKLHRSQAPYQDTGITRTLKGQYVCFGLRINNHSRQHVVRNEELLVRQYQWALREQAGSQASR